MRPPQRPLVHCFDLTACGFVTGFVFLVVIASSSREREGNDDRTSAITCPTHRRQMAKRKSTRQNQSGKQNRWEGWGHGDLRFCPLPPAISPGDVSSCCEISFILVGLANATIDAKGHAIDGDHHCCIVATTSAFVPLVADSDDLSSRCDLL